MVIPVGSEDHQDMYVVQRKSDTEFASEKHGAFVFVPMLRGTVK
jgi:protein-L-isoaspartate(D-aspartate) O-methyltransferase